MFFGKKKEEKIDPEEEKFQELSKKWDGFLSKIEVRFEESLEQTEEAVLEGLEDTDYDINATNRAWHAMKHKLMELTDKIDNTFEEKVKPQMLEVKESWDLVDEDRKGSYLQSSILKRIDRHEVVVSGKFSQKFFDHAVLLLNDDFNCTQCAGDIEIKKDIFRTHYVSCDYCNTVNTFEPNSKVSEIRHAAVDNMARYNAINEWDDLTKAVNDLRETEKPFEGEDFTAYKAAFDNREVYEKLYWDKFLKEKISIMPEHEETFDTDYEHKMMMFYQDRKRELNY